MMTLSLSCQNKDAQDKLAEAVYHHPMIEAYTQALKGDPQNPGLYFQRGQALLQIDAPDLAKLDLQKAMTLKPNELKYYYALGQVFLDLEQADSAILFLTPIVEQNPQELPFKYLLAKAYLAQKQGPKADVLLKAIYEKDISFPGVMYALAESQLVQGDTSAAVTELKKAIARPGYHYAATLLLAESLSAQGNEEAIDYFKQAFLMDTANLYPLAQIGQYYEHLNQSVKAKTAYLNTLYHSPSYAPALLGIGRLLMKEDSLSKALRHFNLAIQNQPNSAEAYYYRGLCFDRTGLVDSARLSYRQALLFDQNLEKARQALAKLSKKNNL